MQIFNLIPASPLMLAFEPMLAWWDYAAGQASGESKALPQGDGDPVLVFPGFGASGMATAALRAKLSQLNYEVYDWDGGINIGPVGDFDRWLLPLAAQLGKIRAKHKQPVSIIGWSLGGMYAHALRNRHPGWVRSVITLATPFKLMRDLRVSQKARDISPFGEVRAAKFHPVHSISIYSRSDGLVDWENCVQPEEAQGHRNIEVLGVSHIGMVYHPEVLRIVAMFLKDATSLDLDRSVRTHRARG